MRDAKALDPSAELTRPTLARAARVVLCVALAASAALGGCATEHLLRPTGGFTQQLGRRHPLAGHVWNVARGAACMPDELEDALDRADFVVLGETHDNRDHHLLEAELVRQFAHAHEHVHEHDAAHERARIAFEMLDEDQAASLRSPFKTPEELARRVHWSESGWPAFELYRPVFARAIAAGMRIVAAHPSATHVRDSMHGIAAGEALRLRLDLPLAARQQAAQREEIRASHCGHANDAMLLAMQQAQAYKDAFMAAAMLQAAAPTVLIAGRGHARNDRAVPLFLHRAGAKSVLSIAFIDVDDDHTRASDYDIAAYDFVVFTPRVTDQDPCQQFKVQLEAMRKRRGTAGP